MGIVCYSAAKLQPVARIQTMNTVEIFTDGGCKGNPGPGGYGCIIKQNGGVREIKGGHPQTTNNIMEMTAAIVALKELRDACKITLTTDSQYVVKGMTEWMNEWIRNGWKTSRRRHVKNRELWQELREVSQRHAITWVWVRGHDGHPENERCDQLANEAIAEL